MSIRICVLALLALLAACNSKSSAAFEFPRKVSDWQLAASRILASNPQPAIPATRVLEAKYERNATILVHAYELPSETVAFETMQRFRQGERLGFYNGLRFFSVESANIDRSTLADFASALQQSVGAQQ